MHKPTYTYMLYSTPSSCNLNQLRQFCPFTNKKTPPFPSLPSLYFLLSAFSLDFIQLYVCQQERTGSWGMSEGLTLNHWKGFLVLSFPLNECVCICVCFCERWHNCSAFNCNHICFPPALILYLCVFSWITLQILPVSKCHLSVPVKTWNADLLFTSG